MEVNYILLRGLDRIVSNSTFSVARTEYYHYKFMGASI